MKSFLLLIPVFLLIGCANMDGGSANYGAPYTLGEQKIQSTRHYSGSSYASPVKEEYSSGGSGGNYYSSQSISSSSGSSQSFSSSSTSATVGVDPAGLAQTAAKLFQGN